MRACYGKAQQYLQTLPARDVPEEVTRAFKRQFLLVAGLKPDEITDDHLSLDEEGCQKLVREKLLKEVNRSQTGQKVVDLQEY